MWVMIPFLQFNSDPKATRFKSIPLQKNLRIFMVFWLEIQQHIFTKAVSGLPQVLKPDGNFSFRSKMPNEVTLIDVIYVCMHIYFQIPCLNKLSSKQTELRNTLHSYSVKKLLSLLKVR